MITKEDFLSIQTHQDLRRIADKRKVNLKKVEKKLAYEDELRMLQAELVNLQRWVATHKLRVAILFEGRDAAGKGGSIKRFTSHLNPRSMRVVALTKPTDVESGQWYFRRYIKELPNPGEMVFFDRSWYNRAVVEPVMGFCTDQQYDEFMQQVPSFEHMLHQDGIKVIKFWFSISRKEQQKRFNSRMKDPLKEWKFSPVDQKGQELWDQYTYYKEQMFSRTHTAYCPWVIVRTDSKRTARLESMRYVLSHFEYEGKKDTNILLSPDPNIVFRYYRYQTEIE